MTIRLQANSYKLPAIERGFTLIELLVVIAIIGLLSTLAIVALGTARQKSRDSRRLSDLKQIQTALEMYASEHDGMYPVTSSILLGDATHACLGSNGFQSAGNCTNQYISFPTDPSRGYYTYSGFATDYLATGVLEGTSGDLFGAVVVTPDRSVSVAGPLIADDANTISHVYFDGRKLIDTKGNAWTMNGTVPQVAATVSFPRAGAGPFSLSNYYSLGNGSDVFDRTGDFSLCVVYRVTDLSDDQSIFASGLVNSGEGCWLQHVAVNGLTSLYYNYDPGEWHWTAISPGDTIADAPSVACFGQSNNTVMMKMNQTTLVSSTTGAIEPAPSYQTRIGREPARDIYGPDLIVYELWFSTTTPSDTLFTAIQQRVLNGGL